MGESFVKGELSEQLFAITLMRGFRPTGEQYYAYLAIRLCNMDTFAEARRNSEFIEPADYGLVLAHGIGNPPADIMQKMEDEYGFCHEHVLDI